MTAAKELAREGAESTCRLRAPKRGAFGDTGLALERASSQNPRAGPEPTGHTARQHKSGNRTGKSLEKGWSQVPREERLDPDH